MMKKLILLGWLMVAVVTSAMAQSAPKREFRSAWVAGMGIDWPKSKTQATAKKELQTYLDNFKKQNFTGVCIHVRPRADAYYKSTLEPWSADITGTRGKDPGWDPLQFAIDECHKRGLECYAWVNPFRVNANSVTYTTDFDKQWDANGWLIRYGAWTSFNPGNAGARKHCLDVLKEIYNNYAIDGMLFDDYFYPGDGMPSQSNGNRITEADDDYDEYIASGTTLGVDDWRRQNVNTFIQELYDDIQRTRPDMRFGIGPAGVGGASASKYGLSKPAGVSSSDWMYSKIYCDPLAWLNDGTIDFISPQIYWGRSHATAPFEPLCKWWSDVANHFGRHNYVSMADYKTTSADYGSSVDGVARELSAQVNLTRTLTRNSAPGAIYYNTSYLHGSYISVSEYLGDNNYQRPALVPEVTWKSPVTYPAPAGLTQNGAKLTWTAAQGADKAIVRYTVYAVPQELAIEQALALDGDGISGEYLEGVTYTPEYTLPAAKANGYWYAVCVYDGYGCESDYTILGTVGEKPVYTPLTDGCTYNDIDGLQLANVWTRTTANGAMDFDNNGSLNRGMVATRDYVYVSGRAENAISAALYLAVYDAATGEFVRNLPLGNEAKIGYYPCNDVIRDNADNIIVSNLTLNNTATPVMLHLVDTATGALTELGSFSGADGRIDHLSVYGDVTTGNYTVFAAVAGKPYIATWTVSGGTVGAVAIHNADGFHPSSAGHFSTAPRTQPVSADQVYVDGQATAWTLYTLADGTAKVAGSFADAPALAPASVADNGGHAFELNGRRLHVYSHSPASPNYKAQWRVAAEADGGADAANSYTGMTALWTVPGTDEGLGKVSSTTCSAPVDVRVVDSATARIYVYSPGNGLACYRLTDTSSGVSDITADGGADAPAEYYNLQGMRISAPTAPGVYLERRGTRTLKRIQR